MLDPRMLQALQNYLGTALGGMLTPEQLATVNTLIQNAPQDPAIQAVGIGIVNPGTSAGPTPASTTSPTTGGSPGGGNVGSTIGFNGQGLMNPQQTSATPLPAAKPAVPTDSSGHVTGSGPGYAAANLGDNRFLPNGQIQLSANDPDAAKLMAAHPQQYVQQAAPAPNVGQATAGQQVGTISQSQQDYIKQQIAATAAANAKAGGSTTGMAKGGVIREPIEGMGMQTGKTYEFGERGPETITPGTQQPMPTQGTMQPGPQMPTAQPQQPSVQAGMPQRPSIRLLGPGGRMFGGPPTAATAGATGKPPPKGDPNRREVPI